MGARVVFVHFHMCELEQYKCNNCISQIQMQGKKCFLHF